MTIIRKSTHPGWTRTVELPLSAMTCDVCGAICDEATMGQHDAWHAAQDLKALPRLIDFLTWPDEAAPSLIGASASVA